MAEGGGNTTFENPAYDPYDNDDPDEDIDPNNYDDDAVQQQSHNTTQPFNPGQASTPYHQWEVQTMQQEHGGLPSYDEKTPLLSAQQQKENEWETVTSIFPNASAIDLETSTNEGRLQVKKAGAGKKLYDLFTKDRSGRQQLNPKLSKEITKALGERAEQIILEDSDTIKEQRQRLAEAEKELRETEKIAAEREKKLREMENLEQKTEKAQE